MISEKTACDKILALSEKIKNSGVFPLTDEKVQVFKTRFFGRTQSFLKRFLYGILTLKIYLKYLMISHF